jgi:hypothetical protein
MLVDWSREGVARLGGDGGVDLDVDGRGVSEVEGRAFVRERCLNKDEPALGLGAAPSADVDDEVDSLPPMCKL